MTAWIFILGKIKNKVRAQMQTIQSPSVFQVRREAKIELHYNQGVALIPLHETTGVPMIPYKDLEDPKNRLSWQETRAIGYEALSFDPSIFWRRRPSLKSKALLENHKKQTRARPCLLPKNKANSF